MKHPSGFAVNPCPTDLLGRQQVFMHMSAHYRRTYSAQSVVDTAPPASLLAKKERADRLAHGLAAPPRTRTRRPHTVAECPEGPVPVPRWPSRLGLGTKPGSAGAGSSTQARQVMQRVLVRQSVRAQRSAQLSSKSLRVYPKPSRAETDPGRVSRRPQDYGGAGAGGGPGAPRRPPGAPRLRRRDHEKSSTFFDELSQLGPRTRTNSELLAEALTPSALHKPRVLRTEVPSRLRYSSNYCPPRPKSAHRTKLEVEDAEYNSENPVTQQAVWTKPPYSSPPVSSRDSAYNGGISSGGESRGPTPDHKTLRKSDKKGTKKKNEHNKIPHSDIKTRRRLEKRLKKKLIEDEREEIHGQRIHTNAWRGTSQEDHSDDIPNPDHDSQADDDSLMEDATPNNESNPADEASRSDQSVEEDVEEEQEESTEPEEPEGDDSDTNKASTEKEVLQYSQRRESNSTAERLQMSTQTDISTIKSFSIDSREEERIERKASASSPTSKSSSASKSLSHESASLSSSTSFRKLMSVATGLKNVHVNNSAPERLNCNTGETKPNGNCIETPQSSGARGSSRDKKIEFEPLLAHTLAEQGTRSAQDESPYIRLIHDITKDICEIRVVTNKAVKAIINKHMHVNAGKLDTMRMQQSVEKLRQQLEVPKDDHLDGMNYGMGSALDRANFSPITSLPSDFFNSNSVPKSDFKHKEESNLLSPQIYGQVMFLSPLEATKCNSLQSVSRKGTTEGISTEKNPSTFLTAAQSRKELCSDDYSPQTNHLDKSIRDMKLEELWLPSNRISYVEREPLLRANLYQSPLSVVPFVRDLNNFEGSICSPTNISNQPEAGTSTRFSGLLAELNVENKYSGGNLIENLGKSCPTQCTSELLQSDFKENRAADNMMSGNEDLLKVSTSSKSDVLHQDYAEPKCVCNKTKCVCTSLQRIVGHLQNWESDLAPPVTKTIGGDVEHEVQMKYGKDCKCHQREQPPDEGYGKSPHLTGGKKFIEGDQDESHDTHEENPAQKDVVMLFPRKENFASIESINEEPLGESKIQRGWPKRGPKNSLQDKEMISSQRPNSKPEPTAPILPKAGKFLSQPDCNELKPQEQLSEMLDIRDQYESSIPHGTGVNSDILQYIENLPPKSGLP